MWTACLPLVLHKWKTRIYHKSRGLSHSRTSTRGFRFLEAGARESIAVINYAATYSHAITHAMGELHTVLQACLADNRAFAPPAHLPIVDKIQKDVEGQIDTMYSALVRLSQANETILAHSLHTMGMTTLWRREAVMSNLSPDLERTRRLALRNSSFLEPGLFDPKLIAEAESYLLAAQAQPRRRRRNRSPRSNRGSCSSSSAPRRSQPSPKPFFQGDHQIQQQQSFRGSRQSRGSNRGGSRRGRGFRRNRNNQNSGQNNSQ